MKFFIKSAFALMLFISAAIMFGCTNSAQTSEFQISDAARTDSSFVRTQTKTELSEDDKTQIIVEILKQENLRDADNGKKKNQNIIYILAGSVPVKKIPEIKDLTVVFINEADIEAKKQSEIVYYEFRDFQVTDSKVVLPVIWNKRDSSSRHSAIIEYECQKSSGKWKVEGKVVGVSVGENH